MKSLSTLTTLFLHSSVESKVKINKQTKKTYLYITTYAREGEAEKTSFLEFTWLYQ